MKTRSLARLILTAAALYDGALAVAFLAAGPVVFDLAKIPKPEHFGYVQFAAAELLIFALMFLGAAARPEARRHVIIYGLYLKVAYVTLTLFHQFNGGIPKMFLLFTALDVAWFFLLFWLWYRLRPAAMAREK